ncbi:hypothetical protein ABPG72_010908 [Tetrahymena utriculariae]
MILRFIPCVVYVLIQINSAIVISWSCLIISLSFQLMCYRLAVNLILSVSIEQGSDPRAQFLIHQVFQIFLLYILLFLLLSFLQLFKIYQYQLLFHLFSQFHSIFKIINYFATQHSYFTIQMIQTQVQPYVFFIQLIQVLIRLTKSKLIGRIITDFQYVQQKMYSQFYSIIFIQNKSFSLFLQIYTIIIIIFFDLTIY